MKRKLDAHDVPVPVPVTVLADDPVLPVQPAQSVPADQPAQHPAATTPTTTFASFDLDARLLQAVAQLSYHAPTLVQRRAIPAALGGRDVLARAKTGSGKTAAYLLPVLNAVLRLKATSPPPAVSALILVPTRELAEQVTQTIAQLTAFCAKTIRCVNVTQRTSDAVQRTQLADTPDIVVATPARVAVNVASGALSLAGLSQLVIDEADLVLSYGYEDDLRNISGTLPKGVQTIMMSATLTSEVDTVKAMFCQDPVLLELEEPDQVGEGVAQYVVKCAEDEKFLLLYVIFKLRLVKGKCIIFVGDVDRCYRLKLFLEQFGTKSCILNSELPVNSRIHVVEEFNKNLYDIIIASDEHEVLGEMEEESQEVDDTTAKESTNPEDEKATKPLAKKRRKIVRKDKDYGVSRGIDFKNVACVLNFDLPRTSRSYTHRIGRTARAGQRGMALSFVIPAHEYRKHKTTSLESTKDDEKVLSKIIKHQAKKDKEVKPFHFDMKQVDAFRYRMNDALRAVTGLAIREARTRELRQELIRSDKLKRHFEENPADLAHLRHDGELRPARVQPHLKHVPEYLLPREGRKALTAGKDVGFVGLHKRDGDGRGTRAANKAKGRGKAGRLGGRKSDPLKSLRRKGKK